MKTKFLLFSLMLSLLSITNVWGYTITFSKGSGDGSTASTTTACSAIVSDGASYLSGNLVTATKAYYNGSDGLKLGASSNAGTIKMNLASNVTPTSIVVSAKRYNASKAVTLKVNGSTAQNITADFSNLTFSISSEISYIQLESSKYCWIESITVNTSSADPAISVSPTSWDFENVAVSAEASKVFSVSGTNLKSGQNLSITVSEGYSVSPNNITISSATLSETNVTVSKNTNTIGTYNGNMSISGGGQTSAKIVALKMNVIADPEPTGTFELFSGDLEEGDYVVVVDGIAMTNTVASNRLENTDVTISSNKISDPPTSIIWHLAPSSSYWTFYNDEVEKYAASTGTKNQATLAATEDAKIMWTVEESNGVYHFNNRHNSDPLVNVNSKLQRNSTYGWACYAAYSDIQLYKKSDGKPSAPSFSPTAGKYLEAQSVTLTTSTEGATIHYTLDGTTPTSESATYSTALNISTTTTIKAVAIKDETSSSVASATYTIVEVEHAGTEADPYTVADARTVIDAGIGIEGVYVKGVVSGIVEAFNPTYGNISYNLSDDGLTTTDQLEAYRGKSYNGENFTSADDIIVGDVVVVYGNLTKYNSTYEFASNNQLVSRKSLSPIAWSTNAYTAELGSSTNEFPTLSGTAGLTITYSSSDPTKAEIAQDGTITLKATGETTITASSAATETYVKTDVSYTLTIEESVVRVSITFVENGGEPEQTDLTEQTNLPNPLPAIAKAGYNFGGWYTDENLQTLAVAGAEITENTTLYAQWLEPYTVAVALVKIDALPDGGETENVYVQGVVTGKVSISGTSAIYDIKDASVDNRLAIYKGKGMNGADVTAGDIQDGDQVVVYGKLYKYVKNQQVTPEVAQGNYLYSLSHPTISVTGVTLPATASVKMGKTITLTPTIKPANASNKNVTWSITSGSDYASVNEDGVVSGGIAAGEAVIQVTTEDGGYTASCTVTVTEGLPDFTDPNHEWIKITNASKLVAGRYYVIGESKKGMTATNSLTSGYLGNVESTISDGIIASNALGTNTAIFELGGTTGSWTLYEVIGDNTGYLNGTTTSNLSWSNNAATSPIAFDENGNVIIGEANGYRILYNNSSPRFKPYTGQQSMNIPQLYMWAELSHSVTFDANGGVAESVPGVERTDEGKIIIPATEPTHEDVSKVFMGWYQISDPSTLYNAGEEFATDVDVTLYAKWSTVPTYTVTYVLGGSGTAPEVTSYPVGKKVTIATIDDLNNPGYLFSGWTVEDAEHNVLPVDDNGQFTMPNSNVKVIAKWARATNDKWVLVTDVTNLKTDGTKYLIASAEAMTNGKYYAMAEQKTNNRAAVEVMHSEGVIRGSSVLAAFVLEDAGDNMFAIKTSNGYLYAASSSKNYLLSQTENNDNGKWTITIEEGVASIVATNSSNRNVMQFNYASNNQIFSCYSSASQKPLALYEKAPMVEIKNNETVQASTVPGADIVIYDGGTLAVDDDATIGDLTVEEGGVVALNNTLTVVGTFTIETTMAGGKSGQLKGANTNNFIAQADAYIDITLGDNGNADKWHAFTVPFPVDALNGIFDLNGNKLTNEQNYAIMDYHGDIRAQGKYGWKKFRGTLVPGTFYLMTVDGNRTTYRMKMKAGSNVVAGNSKAVTAYDGAGATTDKGWNGIGNPTLAYGQVNVAVQVLDPVYYVYKTKDANTCNFIVGTPFFYQAAADGSISMIEANASTYYAPIRKAVKTTEQIKVSLANENYTDNLFISASEDATADYQVGKDLVKMTMTNTPIVPQIFGVAYKTQLSMVHAPLVGDRATYTLNLYAPADGEYTISAQQTEDAIVYLTYEGSPIWNITAGEYNCDLQKGNNSGFGLMLVRRAPQVTTDIEGANQSQNGVRKLLINGQLFIEKEGKLFNVTGQRL